MTDNTMTLLTKNTDKLRAEVAAHVAADSIVQGTYWDAEHNRGCFIGCLAHGDAPKINERNYGLPIMVQRIAEDIFEGLPEYEAKKFFAALPDAVGCDGKDLTRVGWQFLASELRSLPKLPEHIQSVIDPVIAGMDLLANGKEWEAVEDCSAAIKANDWYTTAAYRHLTTIDATIAAAMAAHMHAGSSARWAAAAASDATNAACISQPPAFYNIIRLRQRDLLLRLIAEAPRPGAD